MSGRNGLAVVPGKPRILRVIPETITYTVESADGETVALAGYKRGPTCPAPVSIEADRAWVDWEAAQLSDSERDALAPRALLARVNTASRLLHRDLLLAVVPGLGMDQANVLAGDEGQWEDILSELGWWVAADKDDEDPEATAPAESAPTGAASSPDSQPSTQASIS